MPFSVRASDHDEWERNCLKEYGEFSDCVEYCNQEEFGDGSRGNWYYIDDNVLPAMKDVDYQGKTPNEKAIYFGSYGNDNSPGASYYTHAEIFDMDNPEDVKEYQERCAEFKAYPEWVETEGEDDDDVCEECGEPLKDFMKPEGSTMIEIHGCPDCDS